MESFGSACTWLVEAYGVSFLSLAMALTFGCILPGWVWFGMGRSTMPSQLDGVSSSQRPLGFRKGADIVYT